MRQHLVMARITLAALLVAAGAAATLPGAAAPPCGSWEIEYALRANLKLTDTPLGQGDGVVQIGPGRVVLRFEDRGGSPGGAVQMRRYEMRDHFTVKTRTLFWNTVVENDTKTRATPDDKGVAASGVMNKQELVWSTPVRGYRVDGKITCTGSLCGKFGAPPAGTTEIHIGPNPVQFSSFGFGPDLKRLTMPYTFVTKTKMPKQTSYVELKGNEVRRTCLPP
ncbi:MAG: hypothetical protein IPM35_08270 [Myxococcales bacterium]|nr:hypothetical protein [Myxococcales bacterium]